MGLFDRKKKTIDSTCTSTGSGSLFNDLTQDVALAMMSMKMITQPAMKFLNDDCGVFEGIYQLHINDPKILALKSMPNDTYLRVCGMHAFGASIWALKKADSMGKALHELNSAEVYGIAQDFGRTDAYELALRALNVPLDSMNKRALDQVIVVALNTLKQKTGSASAEASNLKTYMQVLYNAGVTLLLGT